MIRALPHILLTVLVCVLYGSTLFHSFHYDDIPSILEKPWIRGLDKIPDLLTQWNIRPVLVFSFNINHAISGFNVWSYHVVNILLHLGVVFLVYRLAFQILKFLERCGKKPPALWSPIPYLAAVIFAVHPLATQSVTYISSRSSLLATLFYLATIILFFKAFDATRKKEGEPYRWTFIAAGLCLLLGALSKEIIVSIPAILFLYHYYFYSGETFRKWITCAYAPILLVGMPIVIFIVWRVFSQGGILPTGETYLSGATYFLTQSFVIPFEYFWKMLFPINQSIDVNFPIRSDWGVLANYAGFLALGIFVVALCRVTSVSRVAGFGLVWMLITILPTSSFVPLHDVAVEHRTYLPLVGYALFLAATLHGLAKLLLQKRMLCHCTQILTVAIIVCYGLLLVNRNAVWKNEITLWSDAKEKAPGLVRPYNNLGQAYDQRREYLKAIREFEAALKIQPNYVFALSNLGNVYGKMNNFPQAIDKFRRVLALQSDYAPAHYNLARALQAVSKPGEALAHYHKAILLVPHFEQAIYNYALLAMQMGKREEAVKYFGKFIDLKPTSERGYFGLGNTYLLMGKFDEAEQSFHQALQVKPDYLLALINLAMAQTQADHIDQALASYQDIMKRSPGIAGVHKNLGLIYAQHKNDPAQAIQHFEESLRLAPNQPEAPAIRNVLRNLKNEPPAPK